MSDTIYCNVSNEILFSTNLNKLSNGTFTGDKLLVYKVYIGSIVLSLDINCFSGFTNLQSVIFDPSNKITISSNNCFRDCSNLTSINIPDTFLTLSYACFYKWVGLVWLIL